VAEPVVYMIDRYVVGGFYRVHTERGRDENLNAPGMHFEPLAFETRLQPARLQLPRPDAPPNRFYAYGVVARLACWRPPSSSNDRARKPTADRRLRKARCWEPAHR
jgi:glutamate--cysteine ligase